MELSYFEEKYAENNRNAEDMAKHWDNRAEDYNKGIVSTNKGMEEKQALIDEWLKLGVIDKDSTVLDLGCGPGNFTRLLAPHVKKVVGIDISRQMIKYAKENTQEFNNIELDVENWWDLDVKQKGFDNGFDFVIANMTPSICNTSTLNKLIECSRGYCFFSSFIYRTSDIQNSIAKEIGKSVIWESPYLVMNILWLRGMYPKVDYTKVTWEEERNYKEVLDSYAQQYEISKNKIHELIAPLKDGDTVKEQFKTKTARILWSKKDN